METSRSRHLTPQLFLGLIVVFLGVVFTLGNVGIIDSEDYLRYWPALLIIYGLVTLFERQSSSGRIWAAVWIFVGSALLLNNLDLTRIRIWDYWPLVLVLIGIGMMRGSVTRRRFRTGFEGSTSLDETKEGNDSDSVISGTAILGGYKRTNNSQDFRGGELTAIMGGVELDLRDASIKGSEAVLDIFAFWGGVKIRIPEDWTVSLQAMPILGGFEDKTRPPRTGAGKRLVLKGFAIMGGGEIDN
jgi:predicted membrane protein